jgi:hypothetical protein
VCVSVHCKKPASSSYIKRRHGVKELEGGARQLAERAFAGRYLAEVLIMDRETRMRGAEAGSLMDLKVGLACCGLKL